MMRCLLIALCGLVVLAQAAPQSADFVEEWRLFKAIHGKTYESAEVEAIRMNIYLENKNKIESHNENFLKNKVSYSLSINRFADMLPTEMAAFKGFRMPEGEHKFTTSSVMLEPLPAHVDWRTKGVVTPVKDQGVCGSCWAFSATGSLEGINALKTGKLVSLSEQQLVDCDHVGEDAGCDGGFQSSAYTYIMQAGGIQSEKTYAYFSGKTGDGGKCKFDASKVVVQVKNFTLIKEYSEKDLQHATATVGPIAVGIDASDYNFMYYGRGVYDNPDCSQNHLDHGVLVVGYGTTTDGVDYWIVKNSWTDEWGDYGYIYMSRNKNNQCGIATMALYPVV